MVGAIWASPYVPKFRISCELVKVHKIWILTWCDKTFSLKQSQWVQHLQILINKIEPVGGIWWYNGNVGGWSPNFETAYAVMFGDTQLIDMWVPLYLQFSLWYEWADLPLPHVLSLSPLPFHVLFHKMDLRVDWLYKRVYSSMFVIRRLELVDKPPNHHWLTDQMPMCEFSTQPLLVAVPLVVTLFPQSPTANV